MATITFPWLFSVCVIFITTDSFSATVDELEYEIISDKELYERQKEKFVDSLGYGYLADDRNKLLKDLDESLTDNGGHNDVLWKKLYLRKRSAGGSDPFGDIAGISGGSVIHTNKGNISSAVDILKTSTLPNAVIIKRLSVSLNTSGQIDFFVDKSVTNLGVEIRSSCCKPEIVLTDPNGENVTSSSLNVSIKIDTPTITYFVISKTFVPGQWSLTISATKPQDYDVTLHGSSLINIDLDFCDSFGSTTSGQPIPDSNSTYVKVTPLGADQVLNWTYLLIKAMNGSLIQKLPLGALRGSRTSKAFLLPVVWPNMDVHVGVLGQDLDGNTFTREQLILVQPLGVRLLLDNSGAEFINSCNKPLSIPFTVTNKGSSGKFTFKITSSNGHFIATVSPSSVSLAKDTTASGQASVVLKTTPTSDNTVQIVVSVLDSVSKAQYVTKTLIAKDVVCSDTVTHSYVTPSSSSNGVTASTQTTVYTSLFLLTFSLAFLKAVMNNL